MARARTVGSNLRIDVSEGSWLDPRGFCSQTRLVIVAGKGGVGKTTVAAAMARLASRLGQSVLVVEVDGQGALASVFGATDGLDYEERVVQPAAPGAGADGLAEIRARALTADRALVEYLEEHGLARVSRRLVRSGALDVVATAAPGIKDILVLGKVKQLEQGRAADLIIVDAPASGHALSFLLSAGALIDIVRVGPLRAQAEDVLAMVTDPARCRVILVTLPEETPVNEAVETAFALEDRVGVDLGPVVVNQVYPQTAGLDEDPARAAAAQNLVLRDGEGEVLRAAAAFRAGRRSLQDEQMDRLAQRLPLPQVHLPALFAAGLGPPEIDRLAIALADGVSAVEAVP